MFLWPTKAERVWGPSCFHRFVDENFAAVFEALLLNVYIWFYFGHQVTSQRWWMKMI